jgi:hypothetical protein
MLIAYAQTAYGGIQPFPADYILWEAAADISYCIADLEDDVEKISSPLSNFISFLSRNGGSNYGGFI